MLQTPPVLTYGKASRPTRRWWWLGLLVAVAAVAVVAWQKGWLDAAKRMWACYQQNAPVRRAMTYTFPQGMVLWDPAAQPAVGTRFGDRSMAGCYPPFYNAYR